MTTREELHALVDKLPEDDLAKLRLFADALATGDPVLYSLATAPWDDEPETEQELAMVEEGLRDLREGRVVSGKEVEDEFA